MVRSRKWRKNEQMNEIPFSSTIYSNFQREDLSDDIRVHRLIIFKYPMTKNNGKTPI